jgi:hypothetical protein
MALVATDLDGTYGRPGLDPPPTLCISGRTWAEYDDVARGVAERMPLYIRGTGAYGDRDGAALFKAKMIEVLGVTRYYEDDPYQAEIIRRFVPSWAAEIVVVA